MEGDLCPFDLDQAQCLRHFSEFPGPLGFPNQCPVRKGNAGDLGIAASAVGLCKANAVSICLPGQTGMIPASAGAFFQTLLRLDHGIRLRVVLEKSHIPIPCVCLLGQKQCWHRIAVLQIKNRIPVMACRCRVGGGVGVVGGIADDLAVEGDGRIIRIGSLWGFGRTLFHSPPYQTHLPWRSYSRLSVLAGDGFPKHQRRSPPQRPNR